MTFTERAFGLLADLEANNNREWFKAHKAEFDTELLDPFGQTLEMISARLNAKGMEFHGSKKTMFRMHRDTRFSKDKSPYKTGVSGLITPGGTKAEDRGFVYLSLDKNGGFAAFGRYNLSPKALGPIRDRIIEETDTFRSILFELQKNNLDLMRTMTLSSMPRGYREYADHPFSEELKLKSMAIRSELPKTLWYGQELVDEVSETALVCRDFIEFVSL